MEINKNGIVNAKHFSDFWVEPDGSVWEQVLFHNNPTNNLFSSSDDFEHGVYKTDEMWFNFNICKSLNKWEFLYIQRSQSNSSPTKYRWIQTKSPFNASWSDVSADKVTRITTTGYTDGGYGGFFKINSGTYFAIANSYSSNWYGATGCWSAWQGGIPGYPESGVTSGNILVFVRIDNTNMVNAIKSYNTVGELATNDFIEY